MTTTNRDEEVAAQHAEMIVEANEALDNLGPITPATSSGRS